ncbi:MAG: hypothetical protein RIE08_15480 [Acidimicrobiales bacterium]
MDPWVYVVVAVGAALVLSILGVAYGRHRARRSSERATARNRFGSEYDRLVDEIGEKKALEQLRHRHERLTDVKTDRIGPDDRQAFTETWESIQHDFLDAPTDALRRADILVADVMRARNYPVGSIEDRFSAIALEDGDTSVAVRRAHELFVAVETDEAEEATDADFREAILAYKKAFELMLDRPKSDAKARVDRAATEPVHRDD